MVLRRCSSIVLLNWSFVPDTLPATEKAEIGVFQHTGRRGNFPSLEALQALILEFIEYFNKTAKPFRWTYTGRPLAS